MAKRRMFSRDVTDSDEFGELSFEAQALYLHLSMGADDDGLLHSAKKIMRAITASEDALEELEHYGLIIRFESGVIVIRQWNINNSIQKDRYHPTTYQEEKAMLVLNSNNEYVLKTSEEQTDVGTNCIQDVTRLDTEDRLGKCRLDEDRLDEKSLNEGNGGEHRKGESRKGESGENPKGKTRTMKNNSIESTDNDSDELYRDFINYAMEKGFEYVKAEEIFNEAYNTGKLTRDNYRQCVDYVLEKETI